MHATCNGKYISLTVESCDEKLDYALLTFQGTHTHLEVDTIPIDELQARSVALCAFQVGLADQLKEFEADKLGIMPATVVKLSEKKHHLVIKSDTWPGD